MPKFQATAPVSAESKPTSLQIPTLLPKVTITYCTQCRWLLRAAYFAQELLSTFDTALGEVALRPTTGGVFSVVLEHYAADDAAGAGSATGATGAGGGLGEKVEGEEGERGNVVRVLLWDRKAEGGFPETKVLKQRVRDCVQPGRGLGHSDSDAHAQKEGDDTAAGPSEGQGGAAKPGPGGKGQANVKDVAVGSGKAVGRDDCETCP